MAKTQQGQSKGRIDERRRDTIVSLIDRYPQANSKELAAMLAKRWKKEVPNALQVAGVMSAYTKAQARNYSF